ncbi:DUF2877 domain-containing protein [Ornithinibacillus halophilus]|nr:DUF2877 domain-containing protein [Ornithinibacillus halophilus]
MGNSLIFIGNTKNGRLPFGIHLKEDTLEELLSCVSEDLAVFWKGSSSFFFSNGNILMKLDLQSSKPFTNSLPKLNRESQDIFPLFERFLARLIEYGEPIGIDELYVDQFLLYYLDNQAIEQHELATKLTELTEAIISNDVTFIQRTLRYFLGRGQGLTPSGDDILVGLLAVHAVTEMFSHTFIKVLSEIVHSESITTDVSKEYLKYALNKKFSSVVVQIMSDILTDDEENLEQHFTDLVQVGHSSGMDSAFGILIGMLTLRRNS